MLPVALQSQGISIKSGTVLSLGGSTMTVPGNWSDSGSFAANNGTIHFTGNSGNQTIAHASGEIFKNLTVNKGSGFVQLSSNITVNGNLTLISGDLGMNGKTVTLGNSALVQETEGNTIKGNGSVSGTVNLHSPSAVNPFGLGATITSAADLGSTLIVRGHTEQSGGGESSIKRYYDITPSVNTGLNATLQFLYDEIELNGKTEEELTLYRSTDAGTTWINAGGIVNVSANTVSLSGIDGFSRWTLASSGSPLFVELVSFTASSKRLNAELKWSTATEQNNYGFEIERGEVGSQKTEIRWNTVGFVEGGGTTYAPKIYSFIDKNLSHGKFSYRLKQIDRDGKFEYSQVVEVTVGNVPKVFALEQNYPNPFNPSTTIGFTLQESGLTSLKIYDAIGREVATLVNEYLEAGIFHQKTFDASKLSSGIYFARLSSHGKSQIRKMMLMK